VLFAFGLRRGLPPAGPRRLLARVAVTAAAVAATLAANVAILRHDVHFDVTPARSFTPSSETLRVVQGLTADVGVTYFYEKQNPGAQAAKTIVEALGRTSPLLRVRTIDADQHPALASHLGVRAYNVAVIESDGRRLLVSTTEDRDIALGILRVTRQTVKTICFAVGHGQYDIDTLEARGDFREAATEEQGIEGAPAWVEDRGLGRLRRALDGLGFASRKVTLATVGQVPEECALLVEAKPRTLATAQETDVLRDYLAAGGAALLLYDVESPVEPRLAALLESIGLRFGEGVVVDPLDHYFTDEQTVAVARYAEHPITRGIALSVYAGARPVEIFPADGVRATALFSSSVESYLRPLVGATPARAEPRRGPRALAAAAEGLVPGVALGSPFRVVAVGDADFASNTFFASMSNGDVATAMIAWLVREEPGPMVKPPVDAQRRLTLTAAQVRAIFALTAVVLPALVIGTGSLVWWRRRR
jgi:hypothetical protein